MGKKGKLILNVLLLVVVIGIILYVIQNSLGEIFNQIIHTAPPILMMVVLLGLLYQIVEGRGIAVMAKPFQKDFTALDGLFASCYIAFYRVISFGSATAISEVLYYRKKGLKSSQGVGVEAVHMMMYKAAVLTMSIFGLIIQFSMFYENAPSMIPFILAGMGLTAVIIVVLLAFSVSIQLQVWLMLWCNRFIHKPKWRDKVDNLNLQIYSLRETVQELTHDRSALIRIYTLNLFKLVFWYSIPYVVLINQQSVDFLLIFSLTGFAVILAGVIPAPAGIGSFEFVYLLLFKPIVGTVDAVSSMLLYRFASYVLPFLIGMVYVAVDKRKQLKLEVAAIKKEKEIAE